MNMMKNKPNARTTSAATNISDSSTLMVKHIIMLHMSMSGALTAIRMSIWYAFCTFVTSVVIRVIRLAVLNLSMLEKEKKVSSNRQCDYKEINTAELQKQSRQLTSEKMKLYDDYKDGRIDRDSYKQRAEKISVQLDEIKRKIEDAKNSKKLLEQNELSDKIKLKDFLGIQKFDTEKLREIIKVIRVHSQDEIEIEWNFDDIFSEQR